MSNQADFPKCFVMFSSVLEVSSKEIGVHMALQEVTPAQPCSAIFYRLTQYLLGCWSIQTPV